MTGRAFPSRGQGIHGSGQRDYTAADAARVLASLRAGAATVEELAIRTGVGGRTIRQILADGDGTDYLLAGGDDGLALAEYADDAEPLTRRLESQSAAMRARAERRRAYAGANLPRRQGMLL